MPPPSVVANDLLARDLVFRVVVSSEAEQHVDSVAAWLATVVGSLFPVPQKADDGDCDSNYPCAVVAGTLHNNNTSAQANAVHNTVLAVAHRMWGAPCNDIIRNSLMSADNLVIVHESANEMGEDDLLDPQRVAEHIRSAGAVPDCVTAIGISGVSEDYAAHVWREIIAVEREWMDGSGDGYMLHYMWLYEREQGIFTLREMSFNFNWHGHNALCE